MLELINAPSILIEEYIKTVKRMGGITSDKYRAAHTLTVSSLDTNNQSPQKGNFQDQMKKGIKLKSKEKSRVESSAYKCSGSEVPEIDH